MFGYIYVNRPELKIKEFDRYKAHYCGLCRTLSLCGGLSGRMTLNYDMTFLKILLESLIEPEVHEEKRRCFLHPFKPHIELTSDVAEYCAEMNILMAYFNAEDDWKDEHKISGLCLILLLRKKVKNIKEKYTDKVVKIRKSLYELAECEKCEEKDSDIPACCFGDIMGEMFAYDGKGPFEEDLRKCGFYLGKFIYLLDAYEDLEEDEKNSCYNSLLAIKDDPDFEEKIEFYLTGAISKSTWFFERLPLIDDVDILRNILYAGCWTKYESIKEKRRNGSV